MDALEKADLILLAAGLAGLLLIVFLYGLRRRHSARRELEAALDAARQAERDLLGQLHDADLKSQRLQSTLEKERALAAQQLAQAENSRKQLKIEFENLANRILAEKSRSFDKANKDSLEALLKPFREQVDGFQRRVNDVHGESLKGNARLEAEIRKVLEVGMKMGADAKNLTQALKGDSQKRGSWGETQLEKTLQMSGLVEADHYQKQTAMKDAEGRRRQTDFLVNLPGGKHIVIDSKVSLAAYDRAVSAETDEQFEVALAAHVKAVKRHIDDLADKNYSSLIGVRSPGFVLMFMPIEPAYIEALKYEKDLFAYGYERGVVMVSHTTLIPILRTVANLWSMERSTREARELGDKAAEIYNQVRRVAENLNRLGGSLSAVNAHFDKTAKALSGRQGLHGKVKRFASMSSKVTEKVPEINPLSNEIQVEKLELLAEPLEPENDGEALPEQVRAT